VIRTQVLLSVTKQCNCNSVVAQIDDAIDRTQCVVPVMSLLRAWWKIRETIIIAEEEIVD